MKKLRKIRLVTQVDEDFKQQVIDYCDYTGETISRLMRRLLREEIERNPISGGKEDGTSR